MLVVVNSATTHCSFSVKGTGRFLPIDGANPAIGQVGKLEEATEERIEITCDSESVKAVVTAIRIAHSYEEPAIDIYVDRVMRVLVFGDSITYGAWDTEAGWVERLKRKAHKQTVESQGANKLQVINLGIGGDSSTKILKRMPAEIEARYSTSWPLVFVITFGANDERSIDGKVETPIEQFEANVKEIIDIAKQHSDQILFLGIPPIGKPVVEFKGQEYSDERVKQYEQHMQSIVEESGLPFVPIRPAFEQVGSDDLYAYDHIHPNDKGHQLIANLVQPKLEKLL